MIDYSKGKVYRITCGCGRFYIGSTATPLSQRMASHRRDAARLKSPIYQHARECDDWKSAEIVLVHDVPEAQRREHLLQAENKEIQKWLHAEECLNSRGSHQTPEDRQKYLRERYQSIKEEMVAYRQEHREEIAKYHKQHYQENSETIKEKSRKWYEDNKERAAERHRLNRDTNKDTIAEYERNRPNKEARRAWALEKVVCECGGRYTRSGKSLHMKSKKHTESLK